jgi:hypothetical protein
MKKGRIHATPLMFVQVTFLAKVGGSLYPPTRRKVHDFAE